ncbi:Beta-amyrin 28-monooxygenase-like protein [Drosera capensis]
MTPKLTHTKDSSQAGAITSTYHFLLRPSDSLVSIRRPLDLCSSPRYTFFVACQLFMSIDDPKKIKQLEEPFNHFLSGLFSVPIDLPGTQYNRGIKAGSSLRKEIRAAIKQRKHDLAENKGLVVHDILSHLMAATDEEGRYISEPDLINMIVTLLLTSHDSVSATITAVVKFLAEIPKQTEIARSKAKGELLTWDDIQKMKYSWNVVLEALRHLPTLPGSFRQALHEFDYGGFRVPKGWKLHWNAYTTHLDPKYFPEPEKFDPMRFDENIEPYTFVAFGGGPRTCPGRDYARLEILVFMHNLVNRFKLEKVLKDEKIVFNPTANPEHGLPILLAPHQI